MPRLLRFLIVAVGAGIVVWIVDFAVGDNRPWYFLGTVVGVAVWLVVADSLLPGARGRGNT